MGTHRARATPATKGAAIFSTLACALFTIAIIAGTIGAPEYSFAEPGPVQPCATNKPAPLCASTMPFESANRIGVAFQSKALDYHDFEHGASFTSSLADSKGARSVTANRNVRLVDTICYSNLVPGKRYTVVSALHIVDANRNDLGDVASLKHKPALAKTRFTPKSSKGTVLVRMPLNAEGLRGTLLATSVSVFDENGVAVAQRDASRTSYTPVSVKAPLPTDKQARTAYSLASLFPIAEVSGRKETPGTPDSANNCAWLVAAVPASAALLGLAGSYVAIRLLRKQEAKQTEHMRKLLQPRVGILENGELNRTPKNAPRVEAAHQTCHTPALEHRV